MPVYDFKCKKCEETFEKLVKMDTKEVDCPKCSEKAQRTVQQGTASSFILKGNGWYATDFSGKR